MLGYATELWPYEGIQSDLFIKVFRIICGFWKQLGNYIFFFSFKLHIKICMHMLVSLCVRNMLTSFMEEKIRCVRNASENLFQIFLLLLPFSSVTLRFFCRTKTTGWVNWNLGADLTDSFVSSLTRRTVDSKRDTPWPICLFRRSSALGVRGSGETGFQVLAFLESHMNIKNSQGLSHSCCLCASCS